MHRVSSLGLPSTVIQKCLRVPGRTVGCRFLILASRSLTTNCSIPRWTNEGECLDTESFQLGGVAQPGVLSSREENAFRPRTSSEEMSVKESTLTEESESMREKENTAMPPQDAIGPFAKQVAEGSIVQKTIQRPTFLIQDPPFLSGRPWAQLPIKILRTSSKDAMSTIPLIEGDDAVLKNELHVLATTTSAEEGWKAYGVLSRIQQQQNSLNRGTDPIPVVPFAHLHRLARLIARNVPKTRSQFSRLLSVLTTIQNYGGNIQLHEWNALIDHAGRGYRTTLSQNFYHSLSIYCDMIYDRPPGSGFLSDDGFSFPREGDPYDLHFPKNPASEPDIYTYTTLINIAARTGDLSLLHRAIALLKEAGLPPNRITHLTLLKFFTAKRELSGVRSTLARMREQNLDIGVDELNACMLAYSKCLRVDITIMIYRALRHNMVPEDYIGHDDITFVQRRLHREGIFLPSDLWPNEVTFTSMIQMMAYHGNLLATLSVFSDMISTPNSEQGAPLILDERGELQRALYTPTISIFRAMFLGFCRHGVSPNSPQTGPLKSDPNEPEWNLETLQTIFEKFIKLPSDTKITASVMFWILGSFNKTSNRDVQLLRTIWLRIEGWFGPFRNGPDHRLTRWRKRLFPQDTHDTT